MMSCLIAEDEAITGMALADAAEEAGYQVLGPFGRCSAVFEMLAQVTPDIAILDVKLRDGSSLKAAEYLRERAIPYVIYSGHHRTSDMHPAFADAAWVDKPAPSTAVLAALAVQIGTMRQTQAPRVEDALSAVHVPHAPRSLPYFQHKA